MVRVLNCSPHEELRELRQAVLATSAECQVTSATPAEAFVLLERETFDVLVLCYQFQDWTADALCIQFRHANPAGRAVGIFSVPSSGLCELDVIVDPHKPAALIAAACSYPAAQAKFKHVRRLTVQERGEWTGWSCDRCCWSHAAPAPVTGPDSIKAQTEFDRHSCEAFRRDNPFSSPEEVQPL